jgi:hypothetical protein
VKPVQIELSRKFKVIVIWVFVSAILSLYYSNCESYSTNTIQSVPPPTTEENTKSCDVAPGTTECMKEQAELNELHKGFIFLTISGSNTIQLNPYDNVVNVSGNCYQDIFKKTEIYYRLVNDAHNTWMLSNNADRAYSGSICQCVNGQWSISIPINPANVGYIGAPTVAFNKGQSHTLIVEMIVRDENNTLYQNNGTAMDSVGLAASIIPQ